MILDGAVVCDADLPKVMRLEAHFAKSGKFLTTKRMKNGRTYVRIEAFECPNTDVQTGSEGRDGDSEPASVEQPQRRVRRHRK